MTATPDQIARRWLADTLDHASLTSAGSTGVYNHPAPAAAIEPFVTVQHMSERPLSPIGKQTSELYRVDSLIRAWDSGDSLARAHAIGGAIHALIQKQGPASVSGGEVISCYRVAGVPFDTVTEQGAVFRISGGIYAILIRIG